MNLDQIAAKLARWAATHSEIKRVYLFGSRVRDGHRPDSDLDIAVELVANLDECDGLAAWINDFKRPWSEEVQALIPLKIDFQRYGATTPTIAAAIARSSRLVYEKGP